jgi:hypothetical protein
MFNTRLRPRLMVFFDTRGSHHDVQIYGEDEKLYGYEGLVIDVGITFSPRLQWTTTDRPS